MRAALLQRLLAAGTLALVACSPGGRGALEPVAGPGVALASTHGLPDDTARLEAGGVRADVTGIWANKGPSVEISYQAGDAPATVPMASSVRWKGLTAAATAAWDQTKPVPGNVMGRPLLGTPGLRLAARERRTVLIVYDVPQGVDPPAYGDELAIDVPLPGGPRPATFRAGAE